MPQTAGDLGARMAAIVADRFARGASAVILIGSDHPTLGRSDMDHAIRWLQRHRIPSESRWAKDAAQAYHRLAPRYDRRWGRYLAQTLGRAAERIEQACQADRAGRDLRLLDVGCGTGELIRRLTGRIPKIFCTGVDPAWGMLERAMAKFHTIPPQAGFLQGCAERLPFRDGSFDWVVSCNNLHCFQDAAAGVQEMSRVLRPGGRILLLDWCADTRVCRLLNRWCRWFDPTHVWMYGSQQMRRMLCAMGLVVTCGERFRLPRLGRFFGWEMALFVALKIERPSAFRSRTDQEP